MKWRTESASNARTHTRTLGEQAARTACAAWMPSHRAPLSAPRGCRVGAWRWAESARDEVVSTRLCHSLVLIFTLPCSLARQSAPPPAPPFFTHISCVTWQLPWPLQRKRQPPLRPRTMRCSPRCAARARGVAHARQAGPISRSPPRRTAREAAAALARGCIRRRDTPPVTMARPSTRPTRRARARNSRRCACACLPYATRVQSWQLVWDPAEAPAHTAFARCAVCIGAIELRCAPWARRQRAQATGGGGSRLSLYERRWSSRVVVRAAQKNCPPRARRGGDRRPRRGKRGVREPCGCGRSWHDMD